MVERRGWRGEEGVAVFGTLECVLFGRNEVFPETSISRVLADDG